MTVDYRIGDCTVILKECPENHFDSCVTDPPYDLVSVSRGGSSRVPGTGPFGRHREGTKGGGFMGREWDATGIAFRPETWEEVLRVLKPGAYLIAFGGTRTFHRLTCALEDAGFEIRDCLMWLYGSGFPKSLNLDGAWKGWGTALKPAWEPIVLARKPLAGTVAENVLTHGTGGLNIDASRIGGAVDEPDVGQKTERRPFVPTDNTRGRWPANVILTHSPNCVLIGKKVVKADGHYPKERGVGDLYDGGWKKETDLNEVQLKEETVDDYRCVEDCPVRILDEQSGSVHGAWPARRSPSDNWSGGFGGTVAEDRREDSLGGASRFFYCAKASREEREDGLAGVVHELPGQTREPERPGGMNPRNRGGQEKRKNFHPTVKPLALMRYLVRLVTPPNGLVLDPFLGSGTTLLACAYEGFNGLGIEKSPEYEPIIKGRLSTLRSTLAGFANG